MRKQILVFIGLISGLFIAAASSAFAASTDWYAGENSRFRLISASGVSDAEHGSLVAGIEIQLAEGWKTYWRTPGDGLATEIDMTSSENVSEARLLWPAPHRMEGAGGVTSYGYKTAVVLPIRLKPSKPGQDVVLRANILYGVCADLCIPVEGTAELNIPAEDDSEHTAALAKALGQVPHQQAKGVSCSHRFADAQLKRGEDGGMLLIRTAYDAQVTGRDLFVEHENGLALPPARLESEPAPGQSVYALQLENAESAAALRNERLILTMTSDLGSCEISWRVK